MGAVIVLAPLIIGNWALISAAITAAVSTLGYAAARSETRAHEETETTTREEIVLDNADILASQTGVEEKIVVQREGIQATFSRDARGSLKVCLEGAGYTHSDLRRIGQELIDRVTQQYVYNRIVTELKQRKMAIVEEEVAEDRTIKIHVRNW